jgi:8-oxo-dGTP pyrophosphatase MutT (NUDIX family)
MTRAPAAEFVHVFIERDGVGLFLQHRDDIPGIYEPGRLGVFGGHVDPSDQSPKSAGIRELAEETNLRVTDLLPLGILHFNDEDLEGKRIVKIVHAFTTVVSPKLILPVREGQGGITLRFGEPIPKTPRPTRILIAELATYYSGLFPNIGDFHETTS